MGQKVHPLGFRVGITKKHQSQWFAKFHKYNYSQSVLEDRILRNTLLKIFPELLNPVLKKVQKREDDTTITPKITQIKIERGFIPYEIGIQIHAENCELIKSAIDKLKIDRDLACHLQKARQYLFNLGLKTKTNVNLNKENSLENSNQLLGLPNGLPGKENEISTNAAKLSPVLKNKKKKKGQKLKRVKKVNIARNFFNTKNKKRFTRRPKLTKQEYKKKKLVQKRLRNRQIIRRWYRQFIAKGLLINKTGQKIKRKIATKKGKTRFGRFKKFNKVNSFSKTKNLTNKLKKKQTPLSVATTNFSENKTNKKSSFIKNPILNKQTKSKQKKGGLFVKNLGVKSAAYLKIKRKFVTLYLNKVNKKFLKNLKELMKYWFFVFEEKNSDSKININTSISSLTSAKINFAPFGYNKNWDIKKLRVLKNQPLAKLKKLFEVLEKKSFIKLQALKQYYIGFGSLSKTQAYSFFQMIVFLKQLKKLIKRRYYAVLQKYKNKNFVFKQSLNTERGSLSSKFLQQTKNASGLETNLQKSESGINKSIKQKTLANYSYIQTQKALKKIVSNVDDECRKIKFIEYLKEIVKKHRTENLFYYLSTLAEARKDLKKLKKFTQNHAEFLFGLDLKLAKTGNKEGSDYSENNQNSSDQMQLVVKNQVTKILEQANKKELSMNLDLERSLQDSFIEQIEKQKIVSKENLKLTPKICIKFYSVKQKNLEAKASIVADSIIDALEKRKAFRKVIKDAKENLMSNSRVNGIKLVKGVKIQVSGRLNGAEIARTEWVRAGRVPLQTLRANIDYSYKTANTIYGIIGVKVWLFKGYSKTI
uniref:Small ribosomal subunit protein uS3c n=1 Tax=Lobochlamys culleus TaxID=51693 RepID=A0A0S2ID71_9CHLO|nr:ribosomal protein S3 [Lobochlamys culleus]